MCDRLFYWACDVSHSQTGIWGFSQSQVSVYLSPSLFLLVPDVCMNVGDPGIQHVFLPKSACYVLWSAQDTLKFFKITQTIHSWSKITYFITLIEPFCPSALYLCLPLLPPTSHEQLTLPPPCLINSLLLFIQLCSHGDHAESPQIPRPWSLRGPGWSKKNCVENNPDT